MQIDFTDKRVIVTGGAGFLGQAVVQAFLDCGATCAVPAEREIDDRTSWKGDDRVRVIEEVNLADPEQVASFYNDAFESKPPFASVHIAGGFAFTPACSSSPDVFDDMMTMNAKTCYLCCREAAKRMMDAKSPGRIVNVAARPALDCPSGANMVAYTASKAAVAAMTEAFAAEWSEHGIWVNAVAPSIMDTPTNRRDMPDADHDAWPRVSDVAKTIAFLASPENAVTRGGIVPVYGRS